MLTLTLSSQHPDKANHSVTAKAKISRSRQINTLTKRGLRQRKKPEHRNKTSE